MIVFYNMCPRRVTRYNLGVAGDQLFAQVVLLTIRRISQYEQTKCEFKLDLLLIRDWPGRAFRSRDTSIPLLWE